MVFFNLWPHNKVNIFIVCGEDIGKTNKSIGIMGNIYLGRFFIVICNNFISRYMPIRHWGILVSFPVQF